MGYCQYIRSVRASDARREVGLAIKTQLTHDEHLHHRLEPNYKERSIDNEHVPCVDVLSTKTLASRLDGAVTVHSNLIMFKILTRLGLRLNTI